MDNNGFGNRIRHKHKTLAAIFTMKRIQLLIFFCLLSCSPIDSGQQSPTAVSDNDIGTSLICEVVQHHKNDSLNFHISKTIEYLENGKVAKEVFKGSEESVDGEYFYYYKDTLLMQRRFVDSNHDSTATIYNYDANGKLTWEVHFDYKKRLKTDALKDSDVTTADDYEELKTWAITSKIHYKYDGFGRKIEYYAPAKHWDSQNRYTWSYDQTGRISEHKSYDNDELIWTELYTYSGDTIQFTRTWNDSERISKVLIRLDENGRVIDEQTTNGNGDFINRTKSEYYEDGRIKTNISVDKKGTPITTKKYTYVKTAANKKFMPAAGDVQV